MITEVRIPHYRVKSKDGRIYRILKFPDYNFAIAYDNYSEDSDYVIDAGHEFYTGMMHAMAIIHKYPDIITYFPIIKHGNYIDTFMSEVDHANYNVVLTNSIFHMKRKVWYELKGKLNGNTKQDDFVFEYDETTMLTDKFLDRIGDDYGSIIDHYHPKYGKNTRKFGTGYWRFYGFNSCKKVLGSTLFISLNHHDLISEYSNIHDELEEIAANKEEQYVYPFGPLGYMYKEATKKAVMHELEEAGIHPPRLKDKQICIKKKRD